MPDAEHRRPFLQGRLGWLEIGFLALLVVALGLRLWELDGRTMHYDEAIHLHFAWKLANMEEYIHSPWMHGPFQVEMVAALLLLFGDSDIIARLGFALFGTALVALPYLLRNSLGNAGSFIIGAMLAVSPALLYFSRFGPQRHHHGPSGPPFYSSSCGATSRRTKTATSTCPPPC